MGLLAFMKEAGEKLFGKGTAQAAQQAAQADPAPDKIEAANAAAAQAIEAYIAQMQLNAAGLAVKFDGSTGTVTVMGLAPDQETREKIVLCCGNVSGVSQYYMVVKGDTLTKVAREFYGNANAYMPIFEANRPMLSHPDKIYPGQMLRIPKRG